MVTTYMLDASVLVFAMRRIHKASKDPLRSKVATEELLASEHYRLST